MRETRLAGVRGTARFIDVERPTGAWIRDGVRAVTAPGISLSSLLFLLSFAALFLGLALVE
jgi:hypothetical protein